MRIIDGGRQTLMDNIISKVLGPAISFLQNGTIPSMTYLAAAAVFVAFMFGNIKGIIKFILGIMVAFMIFSWLVSSGILVIG